MTSIRQVQTERVLQDVVHSLHSQGIRPTLSEILNRVSNYSSFHTFGTPLPMNSSGLVDNQISNVESFNTLLRNILLNIDVLYESSLRQVDDVMSLNQSLQDNLERLRARQSRLEGKINDYMLANTNSEGHFFVISDNFSDLSMTDLSLTTARIDTQAQSVAIPSVSNRSAPIAPDSFGQPVISVSIDDKEGNFTELSSFRGALEVGAKNAIWAIEVQTELPQEVVVTVDIPLGGRSISKIDFTPYGHKPVQIWYEVVPTSGETVPFGRRIQTSTQKISMTASPIRASVLRLYMRKTEQDYIESRSGSVAYRYIFGAKSISVMNEVYENSARFVSQPIYIPEEMSDYAVIDAVSIDVKDSVPDGCTLNYYLAEDLPIDNTGGIDDFAWRKIEPIASNSRGDKIVRFDGTLLKTRMIRSTPGPNDLQLIPRSLTGAVTEMNPSPAIFEGLSIHRIAEVQDDIIVKSIQLVEGLNTTRITSTNLNDSINFEDIDLPYWASLLKGNQENLTIDYGRIDAGNEFFYGGDVGAAGKDVMVETFVDSPTQMNVFLAEMQKIDPRSRTWDVKVYLNGRELGYLPAGHDRARLPWGLQQGLNHVVLLVRIPLESTETHPYMGAISLMGGEKELQDLGLVRLAKWNYVDSFTMKYNESGEPRTFTIHNGEIISRRRPTDNLQIRYSTETGLAPRAIRVRADFSRSSKTPNVSPRLESYTLRFGYGSR